MYRTFVCGFFILVALTVTATAQEQRIQMAAAQVLQDNGFLKYLLPRFSLKTGVKVELSDPTVPPGSAQIDIVLADAPGPGPAIPLMQGLGQIYYLIRRDPDGGAGPGAKNRDRFVDWALSDIGLRTIESFQIDGAYVFVRVEQREQISAGPTQTGDAALGEILSYKNCGRCHVIGGRNRMKGLGSTPSFALLRGLPDWQGRFAGFYALNPHPSFSQIVGITDPFDPMLPPPIHPLTLDQDGLQAILAYVETLTPADLGKPLVHQ